MVDMVEGTVAMEEDMVDTEVDMAAIMERDLLSLVIDLVGMVVIVEVTDLMGVTVEDMAVMEAMVDTITAKERQDMVDMGEADKYLDFTGGYFKMISKRYCR